MLAPRSMGARARMRAVIPIAPLWTYLWLVNGWGDQRRPCESTRARDPVCAIIKYRENQPPTPSLSSLYLYLSLSLLARSFLFLSRARETLLTRPRVFHAFVRYFFTIRKERKTRTVGKFSRGGYS